ncbi:MAG: metallophosphoesterase family protein [Desulfatibacillum sp.]|nr:metallophosphoesterase family protein [Desulfatibacillum sp.]
MLVYAVADIHGNPHHLETIRNTVQREQPDVLVVAGDLSSHFGSGAREVMTALGLLNVPVFAIHGNTDGKSTRELMAQTPGITDLHLKLAHVNGVTFVGAGGTVPVPFRSRLALFEKGMVRQLERLMTPGCVLVVHPPPFGVTDRVLGRFNAGSRSVAALVKKQEPSLCICGHIHENAGSAMLDGTLVANCAMGRASAGALIHLENGLIPDCQMVVP